MWQSVCSSYCRQHNAVSFSTALLAALYRSIYSLLAWSALGTLQKGKTQTRQYTNQQFDLQYSKYQVTLIKIIRLVQ